jgi:hypothetical protein
MGLKGLMTAMGMNAFASAGLLISFSAFVAILVWVWTRPQNEIEKQARLCIEDDDSTDSLRNVLEDPGGG